MTDILSYYRKRRSIYDLDSTLPISEDELLEILELCILQVPSAFNSQSARMVLLLKEANQKFWQMVLNKLLEVTPPAKFDSTKIKISSFAAGYGTILFFEDSATVTELQTQYPLYKDAFLQFSCQSSGMLQYMVWTALAASNIGASLQHYNPIIDEDVKRYWRIPDSWQLLSQMPFGKIKSKAPAKNYLPLNNRFKIYDEGS